MESTQVANTDTTNTQNTNPQKEKKKKMKKAIGLINSDLLKLVARGSAIIAEILRLKDYIPESYSNPLEEKIYKDIIIDFTYFKTGYADKFEEKIKSSQELSTKDEDFRENNIEIIDRFYSLLNSIYQYVLDWKTIIKQIDEGKYVQFTVSNILTNKEIKHVFCESIFQAGVMLLLVDRLIPGQIREKIMISYFRYRGQTTIPFFNEMAGLFKQTGYIPPENPNDTKNEKRPSKYPVEYFSRAGFDTKVIEQIIGTLTDVDIYEQKAAFPSPDHKTHALSSQASILLVILFFTPEIMEKQTAKMRSIVSNHFIDNWVVSVYMGYTIDINEYWKEFKSAKKAIDDNLNADELKNIKELRFKSLLEQEKLVKNYLNEGIMTEEYILANIENLLNIMRQSNVDLRWFILQRCITNKKYREIVNQDLNNDHIINLLLSVSQFEYLLKTLFQNLVDNKEELWNSDKNKCIQKLNELIAYYSGNTAFNKDIKQENLTNFFGDLSKRISDLNYFNTVIVGRKIGDIKEDILSVKGLYHINESESAKQNIKIIIEHLDHMLRIINVKKSYLIYISKISDFSYAWINIQDYSKDMQLLLKKDSKNVLLLRATFLKLASILNFPLVRLFEIESEDIDSVTNYYSGELVKFVKNILQIIPESVFRHLDEIIEIFKTGFNELPVKVEKNKLKDYMQPEKRLKLAEATHKISLFTKGIYMMEKTLMGVIEVDPKTILEEGIRTELLHLLANTFHKVIDFPAASSIDLTSKLDELIKIIQCINRSFIYIQDYININGSKMWCEEMHRLINYTVELEANKFLSRKIRNNTDKYEQQKYKIPHFEPMKTSPESLTFLGRLTRHILVLTSPVNSDYYPANYAWYHKNREVFGLKIINMIKQAIGVEGFQGFGKLISYINYQNIVEIVPLYQKLIGEGNTNSTLKTVSSLFGSPFLIAFTEKETSKALFDKVASFSSTVSQTLMKKIMILGQIELLRKLQNYSLSENAEVDSYILTSQIKSMNEINLLVLKNLINVKVNYDPSTDENNNDLNNNNLLNAGTAKNKFTTENYYNNLCSFFEDFGFVDTLHTFYYNLSNLQYLPLMLALCTYNELTNYYNIDKKNNTIKRNKGDDNFDLYYFTNGIYILLYQMGKNNIIMFIALLSKLLRSNLINQYSLRDYKNIYDAYPEVSRHNAIIQMFLQEFAANCNIDTELFEINFNSYLMFRNVTNN